jgi:LmbE family N-acetylglucosaminyl deacetylase
MTNDKQQTAMEWFIEELEEKGKAYEENQVVRTINICIDVSDYMELKVQAKERHKQQITNAFWNGDNTDCTSEQNIEEFAEQYYNETYGGGEQ